MLEETLGVPLTLELFLIVPLLIWRVLVIHQRLVRNLIQSVERRVRDEIGVTDWSTLTHEMVETFPPTLPANGVTPIPIGEGSRMRSQQLRDVG